MAHYKFVSSTAPGGGTGDSEGSPWTMAEATAQMSPNDKLWVKAGIYDVEDSDGAVMYCKVPVSVGNNSNWVHWEAYTNTIGDFNPITDNPPVILDGATNNLDHAIQTAAIDSDISYRITGFEMRNFDSNGIEASGGVNGSNSMVLTKCSMHDINGGALSFNNTFYANMCEFYNIGDGVTTERAFQADDAIYFFGCVFHDIIGANDTWPYVDTQQWFMEHCLWYNVHNAAGSALLCRTQSGAVYLNSNTLIGDSSRDFWGQSGSTSTATSIYNNIFYDWNTVYQNDADYSPLQAGFNVFLKCTTPYETGSLDSDTGLFVGDVNLGATGALFVDSANDDFRILESIQTSYPGAMDAGWKYGDTFAARGALQTRYFSYKEATSVGVDITTTDTPTHVTQVGSNGGQYVVRVVNRGGVTSNVKLGLSTSKGTFQTDRVLEESRAVGSNASFTVGPVAMKGNDYLVAQIDSSSVNVMLMGIDVI